MKNMDSFKRLCNATLKVLGNGGEDNPPALIVINENGVYAEWVKNLPQNGESSVGRPVDANLMRPLDINKQDAFDGYLTAPTGKWYVHDNTFQVLVHSAWFNEHSDIPDVSTYPVYDIKRTQYIEEYGEDRSISMPMHLMHGRLVTDIDFILEMAKTSLYSVLRHSLDETTTQSLILGCTVMPNQDVTLNNRGQVDSVEVVSNKMRHAAVAIQDIETQIRLLSEKRAAIVAAL